MTQAIIRIRNDDDAVLAEAADRFRKVWTSGKPAAAVFTFSSPEQLFSVISPKRWQLIDWGLIERTDTGLVHVPYSVVHAEFDLRAVA